MERILYGRYLPNQFVINLNSLLWTNPNNIAGIFSIPALFDAFCFTLVNSVGKMDYDYGSIDTWVDEELGVNDDTSECIVDYTFVAMVKQDVLAAFCNFITHNRAYVQHTLVPVITSVNDNMSVRQDDITGVVRLQYV